MDGDTTLQLFLEHSSTFLEGVTIEGETNAYSNLANSTIRKQRLEDNIDDNLAGLLENETGVHLLKTGGNISKPVVHGLYGIRLAILNNGIPQNGQQWGNGHSPEIDPLVANSITVIKGSAALEFGGGNLGSLVLLKPGKISNEPHLHGRVGYTYETNGRGNNFNVQLQKNTPFAAWRVTGTYKRYGDRQAADYFLRNTGSQELNAAFQMEKSWNDAYFLDIYASTFNTELGVLRGSHIGNITDLESALSREIPFFTENEFNRSIDAPKQRVSHHLFKVKLKRFIDDNQFFHLIVSGQINDRKEFDVRRGNRSAIPALSLTQSTFFSDFKYQNEYDNKWVLKIGNQNTFTDNINNPGTGILPLIPNYDSFKSGFYATADKKWNDFSFNGGVRYDFEFQKVVAISNSFPREILRFENEFHNFSGILGVNYAISNKQSLSLSSGYSMRNPGVNELYSNGLHQGVSGIEEGDPNLTTEKALKTTLEYKIQPSSHFSVNALAYLQNFQDYIYLQPQDQVRLTIRGAFPVFRYEQTDANIYGLDISTQFTIRDALNANIKYSYIRGDDTSRDIPLVYIPPNSFNGTLTYRLQKAVRIANIKMEDLELEWNNRYVFEQTNLLEFQDFVPPPDAYYLMGLKLSTNLIFPSYKIRFLIKVDNLLDTAYRDYLNRQRYFADDLGRSIVVGVNLKF